MPVVSTNSFDPVPWIYWPNGHFFLDSVSESHEQAIGPGQGFTQRCSTTGKTELNKTGLSIAFYFFSWEGGD